MVAMPGLTWPLAWWLRYLFSRKARLNYEAEAYAVSVKNGLDIGTASSYLSTDYRLKITYQQAKAAIQG